MHFFALTVRNHIVDLVERIRENQTESRKTIIMIPAMPEKTLVEISEAVSNYFIDKTDTQLTLKIAKVLTDGWQPDRQKKAGDNNWLDERGNLTYYRSNITAEPDKFALIVLCGADRVTDAASLADFHSCDPQMIWETKMKSSFKNWVKPKLENAGIHQFEDKDLQNFDRMLLPLLISGRGDILQISDWLETMDLNSANDVSQALKIVLSCMAYFDLPRFTSFPIHKKSKQLTPYINQATEFFNYSLFIDPSKQKKALETIGRVIDALELGEDTGLPLEEETVRGDYPSGQELILGLKKFIESDDQAERTRLAKSDFVVISDQILKFKRPPSETKEKPKGRRKLAGGPVDVFLSAIWTTLKEFYSSKTFNSDETIQTIGLKTERFKHDTESNGDDGSESAEDKTNLAREYLIRLIGGIDDILPGQLSLAYHDGTKIEMTSQLTGPDIVCTYSKTAEPALEFTVFIEKKDKATKPFKRKFAWRLPEHHMYRLSAELMLRANQSMESDTSLYKLPVFHLAYYDELLRASSDEEICRVLLHCIRDERDLKKVFTNLLTAQWLTVDDPILPKLRYLAKTYGDFIRAAAGQGLFSTIFMEKSQWGDFRRAYADIFEEIHKMPNPRLSTLAGMMVRTFLVVQPRPMGYGETWHADVFETSGVVTILHPAVIEMLEAQIVYQARCFNYAVNMELNTSTPKNAFKAYVLRTLMGFSTIQSPLTGLLKDDVGNLDTSVRGRELIHRIGLPQASEAPLSTRILKPYQESLDENGMLNDSEIFQETSESRLLLRLMQDYFDLHPHARDGLSLAVFRNKDIQPVIAAVHAYLKVLATPPTASRSNRRYVLGAERRLPYAISVTLFTESNDDTDVAGWIEQWRERWEAAETEKKYQLYRQCRFSIAHRVVEKNGVISLQKLVNEQFETDIAVLYNFIWEGSGVDTFENVEEFDVTSRDLKFPILEKACCMINNPSTMFKRSRVISNRQFTLGAYHANLLHGFSAKATQEGTLVIGTGDFTPWRPVVDALHKKAEWVICIDPNMDDRLIKTSTADSGKKREIIGFGSGVGTHGGDNYTISTEQFSLADIGSRLSASIQQLYAAKAEWTPEDCMEVTKGILSVAKDLSGLSLIRATGAADQYIRDFMAYSLSRKMLKAHDSILCESLISLDAYRHWFDLAEDNMRPDLMWIQASIGEDKRFHLNMNLIECKMGNESSGYISKAALQIENGLRVLVSGFMPLDDSKPLEDERPDRRHWWMQLHRLIACRGQISKLQQTDVLTALERLAEGDYDIEWRASVFIFRINRDSDILRKGYWQTDGDITANIYTIGGEFVRQLATSDPGETTIDWAAMGTQGEVIETTQCGSVVADEDDNSFWEMEDIYEEDPEEDILELQPRENDENQNLDPPPDTVYPKTADGDMETNLEIRQNTEEEDRFSVSPPPPLEKDWDRIFLGRSISQDRPVYWEFGHRDLANRHMLIFGSSGQGKTYAIQCMLCEMIKFRQKSLIVDYTNGFLPNHLESETNEMIDPEQHVVSNEPLPINPFLPQESDNGGILIKETPNNVAKRIAGLFNAVYHIGDQQYSVLHRAIMDGVETLGEQMSLEQMLAIIEEMTNDKKFKSAAQTLYNKLRPFVLDRPFSHGEKGFDWSTIFQDKDPLCNIFQLVGMDPYTQKLITEFILWDLYGFLQSKGRKNEPKVVVLDEVQNLDHQENSPLSKYLREGRKFGLALMLATQTMSNMKKDEQDRMFNAEHKLFFRPTDTELQSFAKIAASFTSQSQDEWMKNLSSLKKGECYSIGRALNEKNGQLIQRAEKIRITALKDRGFNE
jgi:DNA phosphorothioation-dependent restriction protein DptH